MRTVLENGASHITIVCREINFVISNLCNWIINSSKTSTSINDIIEIMKPFYELTNIDINTIKSLKLDGNNDYMLNQKSVPAGSDMYFIAQALGKLTVKIGEIDEIKKNSIILNDGSVILSDIILKCIGFETNSSKIDDLFDCKPVISNLWINNDPNLFVYNDGINFSETLSNVKSLLCGSYLFFVQSFAKIINFYINNKNDFYTDITKGENSNLIATFWNFIENDKKKLSLKIHEECSFDNIYMSLSRTWEEYIRLFTNTLKYKNMFDTVSYSAIQKIQSRDNHNLGSSYFFDKTLLYNKIIQIPVKKRVLFLSGQGMDSRITKILLERTGWLENSMFDYIIPDAPFKMPAFTNEIQLDLLGMTDLKNEGIYDINSTYYEWNAGFSDLLNNYNNKNSYNINVPEYGTWNQTLDYLKNIINFYGPFDGIIGFCEGATVASVALMTEKNILNEMDFFIAISPWKSPFHDFHNLYKSKGKFSIPTLHIVGDNDMEVFKYSYNEFIQHFSNSYYFKHKGKHVYPRYTTKLNNEVSKLLNFKTNMEETNG